MVEPIERPRFYDLATADGVTYEQLARLHGSDVLATTVVQTCIRYARRRRAAASARSRSRCARARRPRSSAPRARRGGRGRRAARRRAPDGHDHRHVQRPRPRRRHLARCVRGRQGASCRPPDPGPDRAAGRPRVDRRARQAGADAIGIHIESLDPEVRARWTPGKATVPLSRYWLAWERAVAVVRPQQGLDLPARRPRRGPRRAGRRRRALIARGVYPFVVPYRPLVGSFAHARRRPGPGPGDAARRHPPGRLRAGGGGHARRRPGRGLRGLRRLLDAAGGGRMTARRDRRLGGPAPAAPRASTARARAAARVMPAAPSRLPRAARARSSMRRASSPTTTRTRADLDPRTIVLVALSPPATCSAACGCTPRTRRSVGGAAAGSSATRRADRRPARAGRVRPCGDRRRAALRRARPATARGLLRPARVGARRAPLAGRRAPHALMRFPMARFAAAAASKEPLGDLLGALLPTAGAATTACRSADDMVACVDAIVPAMVERDPEWAGWCGMLVTAHDLAAMGAEPVGALDTLGARDRRMRKRSSRGSSAAPRRSACRSSADTRTSASPARSASPASAAPPDPIAASGGRAGDALHVFADLGGGWRPGYTGRQWDSSTHRTPKSCARCSTPSGGAPERRQGRLHGRLVGTIGMLAEASGCGAELDVAAIPRPQRGPRGLADLLPGLRDGHRRRPRAYPSPATRSARCGTLTAEPGVRLRWPDGEITTALGAPSPDWGPHADHRRRRGARSTATWTRLRDDRGHRRRRPRPGRAAAGAARGRARRLRRVAARRHRAAARARPRRPGAPAGHGAGGRHGRLRRLLRGRRRRLRHNVAACVSGDGLLACTARSTCRSTRAASPRRATASPRSTRRSAGSGC